MPAAAALPVRKRVGSDQNGPRVPRSPTAAIVSAIMAGHGDVKYALAMKPSPPIAHGIAMCRKRSPVRSELAPIAIMPIAAATYGSAEIMLTVKSLRPERPRTICGIHSVRP